MIHPEQELVEEYVTVVSGSLLLTLYVVCWGLSLLSLVGGRLHKNAKCDLSLLGDEVPGVSIVTALNGVADPLLEVNLESRFILKYPKFELLFCFHDDRDPAIDLVRNLQVKYPKVSVRLFWKAREDIPNFWVRNLIQSYEAAVYDYVWNCSSKIQVTGEMLEDMVVKLQPPDVALVHQFPFCVVPWPHTSIAAAVQQIYFGCALARYYLSFNLLSMCCVVGLSYMLKKSLLEQQVVLPEGLAHVGAFRHHDFFLTKTLHQKGFKLVMSAFPAEQNVNLPSVNSFVDRMVRWTRLRLGTMTFVAGVLEPLSECFPLGLFSSYFFFRFFGIPPLIFLWCHLAAWICVDFLLLRKVQNGPLRIGSLRFLYCWFLRQILSLWIYAKAVSDPRHICWDLPHKTHRVRHV